MYNLWLVSHWFIHAALNAYNHIIDILKLHHGPIFNFLLNGTLYFQQIYHNTYFPVNNYFYNFKV